MAITLDIKNGGHVVNINSRGFSNMEETYYLKQDGIVTINYAYKQDNAIMYPDLIKVKAALDNGEILGVKLPVI